MAQLAVATEAAVDRAELSGSGSTDETEALRTLLARFSRKRVQLIEDKVHLRHVLEHYQIEARDLLPSGCVLAQLPGRQPRSGTSGKV